MNSPGPSEFERLNTLELRGQFLLDNLLEAGRIHLISTGLDRLIAGGIAPVQELQLEAEPDLRADFFNQRRETGVINIGAPSEIVVDGFRYLVGERECLYIGMGARDIRFRNGAGGNSAVYLLSCPAHREFPTRMATQS